MPVICCVPGCYRTHSADSPYKFHRFPENPILRRKWITAINRKDNDSSNLFKPDGKSHRVCSFHFVGGVKTEGAIPSVFQRHEEAASVAGRLTNAAKRAQKPLSPRKLSHAEQIQAATQALIRHGLYIPEVAENVTITNPTLSRPSLVCKKYQVVKSADHTYGQSKPKPFSPTKTNLQNKVNKTAGDVFTLMKSVSMAKADVKLLKARTLDVDVLKDNSANLNLYTGFKDYQHFKSLIEFLRPDAHHLQYPSGPVTKKLSFENSILMTITKYKLDTPQDDLAFRFGIKQADVSRIITTFTDLMHRRFRETPIWPSQALVQSYMPDIFKAKYPRTRVIIDCTEIFIQRPSSAEAQQLTYSTYKSHNTAKALIGITPNCFISFIPDIQPGRLSDKEIVVRSGLIDLLDKGDLVMADRGFTIEDLLDESMELNIPPFLHGKTQFDEPEVKVTRSIAGVRIHVERVIGRVRRYRILNTSFPNNSLTLLNKVWINCCYLTNLQHPTF